MDMERGCIWREDTYELKTHVEMRHKSRFKLKKLGFLTASFCFNNLYNQKTLT